MPCTMPSKTKPSAKFDSFKKLDSWYKRARLVTSKQVSSVYKLQLCQDLRFVTSTAQVLVALVEEHAELPCGVAAAQPLCGLSQYPLPADRESVERCITMCNGVSWKGQQPAEQLRCACIWCNLLQLVGYMYDISPSVCVTSSQRNKWSHTSRLVTVLSYDSQTCTPSTTLQGPTHSRSTSLSVDAEE